MCPKIKICGFTQADNAREASLLGIDAVGLVFYDKSPRYVEVGAALEIVNALPPFINRVGLFVNADSSFIDEVLCEVPLDTLQFHGDEAPIECSQYAMPFIKALRVHQNTDLIKMADDYRLSCGLLLDAFNENTYGGTGEAFDWSLAKVALDLPIILAGGLNSDTVADAVKQINPYALDISSGVESAKGVKDIDKIKQFIANIK
ncbi:Phosphoribosylanthranilate isomerase (EC 5.3.1.24) [uncultured Gammaproteobacteria bacterium]|uniref:phosphoribosylanthranilate isomerase n=1 Tax=thiotrophic endosymbiont of Bathymodiolus puteoserpentis (Logatchev) TaxID=343240 RepID=UPI0010B51FE8|nr:phosphoribosylanthranilate isomerase [thiotrophic endosymbiont of Bathymodiolus puteoserpentis (Logatchev)]CAC9585359.1 Phosphoribosylanthranilate isomerase (EC 5.3.1.24) [uncultured Gammaproteobacteria bacterium]CAC9642888.1 Phosphoribosylanthranilate isomerase (EC 5.3.1.24) [uncultured Gammaproteobacteria bacterium]CAC9643361.1 Phosphoribosylanthranilate isomerase (EC 5.3.1.24) [uncultured Gammaproteobacteria bacterium]CAC9646703.1 Phosphoribosylanthranilate isomerase (EC 5.3.1.24) [uncult